MPLSVDQRTTLTEYARKDDRQMEPVFVGRNNLFDVVHRNAQNALSDGSCGKSICLHGPPGVGKSAFLSELKDRCVRGTPLGEGATPKLHFVNLLPGQVRYPSVVLAECAEQIEGFTFGQKTAQYLRSVGFQVNIAGLGGIGGNASFNKGISHEQSWTFPTALFRDGAQSLIEAGDVFLLAVDEANDISPPPDNTINQLLQHLHLGTGLPIVPVLVGQPNTVENLSTTISGGRYATGNQLPIVGLEKGDGAEYAKSMFTYLGIEGSRADRDAVAQWIEKACDGWPHHMSNAMKCIAKGLLDADSIELRALNGATVERRLSGRRVEYYRSRLSSGTRSPFWSSTVRSVLSEMLPTQEEAQQTQIQIKPIPSFEQLEKHVEKALFDADAPPALIQALPYTAVPDMISAMRRSGVIAEIVNVDKDREYTCPIGSLMKYVLHGSHQCPAFPDLSPRKGQTFSP